MMQICARTAAIFSILLITAGCSKTQRIYGDVDKLTEFNKQGEIVWNSSMPNDGSAMYFIDGNGAERPDRPRTLPYVLDATGRRPVPTPGIARASDLHVSPDGAVLYVTAYEEDPFAIYAIKKLGDGWAAPERVEKIQMATGSSYPATTENGDFYFTSLFDIYVYRGDEIEKLPDNINSPERELDPFISQDDTFLMFLRSVGEEGEPGVIGRRNNDMFISFKTDSGWTDPEALPAPFNAGGLDGSPYVTPDRKYIFFTSNRTDGKTLITYQAPFYDYYMGACKKHLGDDCSDN